MIQSINKEATPILEERSIGGHAMTVTVISDGQAALEYNREVWIFPSPSGALAAWFAPSYEPTGWTKHYKKQ